MLVLEVATDALRRIGVIGQTKTPSAEQGANAVTRLNNLMARWEEKGVSLGYGVKATTADTLVLPRGLVNGITAELAESLAGDYGVEPPRQVAIDADQSRTMLQRAALQFQLGAPNLRSMPLGEAGGGLFDIATGRIV